MRPQSASRLWKNHVGIAELRWPARLGQEENARQDAQKGRPARPQQAKRRGVLCSVRGAFERSENAAGGLFQHPARRTWWTTGFLSIFVLSSVTACLPVYRIAGQDSSKALETVHGTGCYNFDGEATVAKARRAATTIAQEQAVRSHHVFVDSSARVKNFQLEEDLIQTTSAAMLYEIKIEKEERKAQEICIILTAKISPVSIEDMIKQRIAAKEIAQDAQGALVQDNPAFGLKVWTNKAEGRFLEGEKLVIYVQSDRDAYLKLDYFQADGTVVHIVPNVYRGQAFIKGGKKYAFGDETSPEHLIIKGPYGAEVIKGIVSMRPFETSLDSGEAVSDSRTYLNGLQSGLRGIKVVATTSSVELQTTSRAVEEYKKDTARREPGKTSR